MVVKTYMDMDQDSEEEKQQYLALALHLASEFFLRNPNKDVRLLVACCLADIFRIYAPEAPYTSHDKLKVRNWPRTADEIIFQANKHWPQGNSIQKQSTKLLYKLKDIGKFAAAGLLQVLTAKTQWTSLRFPMLPEVNIAKHCD